MLVKMKRSRTHPQRYQEVISRSASAPPSVPSSPYPQGLPQSSLVSSEAQNMIHYHSIDDSSFENLPPHRYAFKLLSIFTILGITLWSLGHQSDRFRMEGAAGTLRGVSASELLNNKNQGNNNRTGSIAIAHLGNSIQYFNDCPRMLEHMMTQRYANVAQDSCLRGGANVTGLFEKGNGMLNKFATPAALKPDGTYDIGSPTVEAILTSAEERKWDFVVINDHTQAPARETNKTQSIQTFREKYIPLLERNNKDVTVILLMTAAYKSPAKNSSDLGDFDNFTKSLVKGYAEYVTLFSNVKVAPLGLAYQYIKEHNNNSRRSQEFEALPSPAVVSWEALYAPDDFHPSPHGTYLEACLLYCTITGQEPPEYQVGWWSTARYMQPPTVQPPMPLPTAEEANYLRRVASHLCKIAPGATSSL